MIKQDSKRIKELKHLSRRRSIKEGIFATASFSFGSRYISPFAIAINTSNSLVALLGAVWGLLSPISQMFSSRLIEKYSRKKIVTTFVLLETLMWLPFILIGILYYKGIMLNLLPIFILTAYAFHVIISSISGPAWFSWMGDIVDGDYRGRWFAKRNLIVGFVGIILTLIASFALDYFKKMNLTIFGFIILFALAVISRFMSYRTFKKQYEPKIKLKKGYYFSFWDFVKQSPKNNFGRFAWYRATLSFATAIAGSLIAVYLLRDLKLGYSIYMIVSLSGSFISLFLLNFWGKISDKYGNYKVLLITSFLMPTIPLLWILYPSPIYLALVPSIIGSVAWAGFNLSAGNFIYDNVSSEKRGLALSYQNMFIGLGSFFGAGLGALLIKYLHTTALKPIIIIFIISGILRAFAVLFWIPSLKEVSKKNKNLSTKTLEHLIIKDAKPTLLEEAHQVMSIKSYIFNK